MLFKLSIFFIVTVNLSNPQVDWWYDMDDRDIPPSLQYNPYYQAHQYMQNQMNLFGYAQHVGKIYRGQYFNPELNRPRDRAYGYQSDFNNEEFNSGAFRNPSEGQRIRASQVLVSTFSCSQLPLLYRLMSTVVWLKVLEKLPLYQLELMSSQMALS